MKKMSSAVLVFALAHLAPLAAEAKMVTVSCGYAFTNGVQAASTFCEFAGGGTGPAYMADTLSILAQPPAGLSVDKWWLVKAAQASSSYDAVKQAALKSYASSGELVLSIVDEPFSSAADNSGFIVYADYSWLRYRISYESNGATGTVSDPDLHIYTNAVSLAQANSLNRTGYTFRGWGDSASAASVRQPGVVVTGADLGATTSGVVTLYANWTPVTYSIQFSKGEGTSGTMPNMALTYDVTTNLPLCAFSRTGYTFNGWKATVGGSVRTYADGAEVSNLASAQDALLEFEAQWLENSYSVKFDSNGGQGAMSDQGFTYSEEKQLSANAFTRDGYSFAKWTEQADGSGASYTNRQTVSRLVAENGGTLDLYAQWSAIPYSVKYDANGGEGSMASVDCTYDLPFALAPNEFTRVGYTFQNWTNATGEVFADGATVSNLTTSASSTQTLYAAWSPITYTIQYHPGSPEAYAVPTGSMTNEVATFDEPFQLLANTFWRTGYAFVEWTNVVGAAFADAANVLNLASNQNDVVDLWATWTPVRYSVRFDSNGGTGSMDDMTSLTYGVEYVLPSNSFVNGVRAFDGWSYPGGMLADGAAFSNLTNENNAVVTLSARWMSVDADLRTALDVKPNDNTLALGANLIDVAVDATATNGTCLVTKATGVGTKSTLTMEAQSSGVLRFRWRTENPLSDDNHSFVARVYYDGSTQSATNMNYISPSGGFFSEDWQDAEIAVTNSPARIEWEFDPNGDDACVFLDCFDWVPDNPPSEDPVAVSVPSAATGLVYSGAEQTGVTNGVGYTLSGNVATNAGDYVATATLLAGYSWTDGSLAATNIAWSIAQAVYDMSGVSFTNATFEADGEAHSIFVSGDLPDGVSVSYTGNGQTEAGSYPVAASFTGDAVNYEAIQDMTATMTLASQQGGGETNVKIPVPAAAEGLVYSGAGQTGVADGDGYTLAGNVATNAGNYVATATLSDGYAWSDGSTAATNIAWSIAQAVYDMSGVSFTNATFEADGEAHSIFVSGDLPDGVAVAYVGNGQTEAGSYPVTASFTGDAVNYEAIQDMTATMTIEAAPGPGPEPEPGETDLELHPAGEPSLSEFTAEKAATYVGWLKDASGKIAAQLTVKTSAAKSGKAAKSTVTVTPVGGKKYTLKTTVQPGGNPTDELGIAYGALGLAGMVDGLAVEASADVAKSKDASVKALAGKIPVGTYTFAVETDDGVAAFSASVAKNGKTKVQGTLGNGTKVSVSTTGSLGDAHYAVPVVVSKSKVSFGFVLWIPLDGGAPVFAAASGSSWQALRTGGAFALVGGTHAFDFEVPAFRDYIAAVDGTKVAPVGEEFAVSGTKWVFSKASGKLKATDGVLAVVAKGEPANLSGLKLTCTAKTGLVKGSFKLYYMEGGKLKSDKVTVSGVVAEGVFVGNGTVKKLGSFRVTAQ